MQAREALRLTESRFHDLFRRIPTALVVHRMGRVLDANPAAVALFGYPDLASMLGQDVLQTYEAGDSRDRARSRLTQLQAAPPGERLAPAEYHLQPTPGRTLIVQASSVTVGAEDGGSAALTIYIDDTERRQAEEAMQRSEAMLSHLVANSPDLITLTELSTGRYAMVNPSFAKVTGYEMHEVIGRTSAELDIWADPADRDRLVDELRRSGTVQSMSASFRVRDGRLVSMLLSAARFTMDGRDYLIINARDITAAEQARLEREAILENALVGIALTRDQHFMMVNPRFEQMMGWPPGQLVRQHASVVWPSAAEHEEVGQMIGPRLAQRRADRDRAHGAAARRQPVPVPPDGQGGGPVPPQPRRHHLAGRGRDRPAPGRAGTGQGAR